MNKVLNSYLIIFLVLFKITSLEAQCNLLCNTDFENLQNSPSVIIVDTSLVPCWGTTASDNKIEVWHNGFNGVSSYSGNQFIELNAFFVSTLFQNFTTTPGASLIASFAHRGRVGVDVMSVEVGPVGGPYTVLGTYSDGNSAWGYYTVNYNVPMGLGNNYTLRFNSVSAAGSNQALGNFLDAISVSLPSNAILTLTSTPVSCSGTSNGTAQSSIIGGASPFTFTWSPFGGNSANASALSAGIYSLNIKESNGCTKTGTVLVASGTSLTLTATSQSVSCFGSSDGSAQVSVNGGSLPYSFSWTPGGLNTQTITSLSAGIYTVNVSSQNGCVGSKTVSVAQATPLNITISSQSVSCFGASDGSAQVTVSGGSPYSYTWTPSGLNTATVNSLFSGIYTVNVGSSNGCVQNKTLTIAQGMPLSFSLTAQNATCFGAFDGSIQSIVSGGNGPYSYTWAPTGGNSANANNLTSGIYTIQSTSFNGCIGSSTVNVNQGSPLNISVFSQSVSCLGATDGSAQAIVNGGTGPFSFTWTPLGLSTSSVSGLASGNYTVQASSSSGCIGSQIVSIAPGLPINLSIATQSISCFGLSNGSARLTVNGGAGTYTYSWMPNGSTTSSVTGLSFGIYTVQVTGSNGCTGSQTLSVIQAPQINVSVTSQSASCSMAANGSSQVFVTGGTSPYSYTWAPSGTNLSNITGLLPGTYSCNITDQNLCKNSATVEIKIAPSYTIGVNSPTICVGQSVILSAFGAISYTWMPGNTNGTTLQSVPLTTTTYTLIGENQFGCRDTITSSIYVYPVPIALAGNDTIINMDELITLYGIGSDTYGWIAMTNNLPLSCNYCHVITENPQKNTCYVLEAVNAFNCRHYDTVCVIVTQDWSIYIPNAFTPNNNDLNDVFIPVGYGIDQIELLIFDRWGELIFKSEEENIGWNGTYKNVLCKSDVYTYMVNFKTMNSHKEQRTGSVTLLK